MRAVDVPLPCTLWNYYLTLFRQDMGFTLLVIMFLMSWCCQCFHVSGKIPGYFCGRLAMILSKD